MLTIANPAFIIMIYSEYKKWMQRLVVQISISAPPSKKLQYLHFRFHANYFLLPWRDSWRNLADDQCSSIKQYLPYHTVVDWPEIGRLMEVFADHCVFTWYGRYSSWIFYCQHVIKKRKSASNLKKIISLNFSRT